ncbi:MAG: DUF2721 domain-containing protein [Pseudomonadota bacterium]
MPDFHILEGIAGTIQLAVAPVFLLTGLGALLGVLTGRLARIVDRARKLESERSGLRGAALSASRRELLNMMQRIRLINWAISLCTFAELLVCVLIALLFLADLMSYPIQDLLAALFVGAMGSMTLGLLFFLREIYLAIGMLRFNVDDPDIRESTNSKEG